MESIIITAYSFETAIKQGDIAIVVQGLALIPYISRDLLLLACNLPSSGILRLLLTNQTANPNHILGDAILTSSDDIVVALLESDRIKPDTTTTCVIFANACTKNRLRIVKLLLADRRFVLADQLYLYLCNAVSKDNVDLLELLCGDVRFDIPKHCYDVLQQGCTYKAIKCIRYLFQQNYCNRFTDKVVIIKLLICAVESEDAHIFALILQGLKSKIHPNEWFKFGIDAALISACFDPARMIMFEVLVANVNQEILNNILNKSISVKSVPKVTYILNHNIIQPDISILIKAIEMDALNIVELLLTNYKVPICCYNINDNTGICQCTVQYALKMNKDQLAHHIIMSRLVICTHLDSILQLALERQCLETLKYLLTLPCIKKHLTLELAYNIIKIQDVDIITLLVNTVAIIPVNPPKTQPIDIPELMYVMAPFGRLPYLMEVPVQTSTPTPIPAPVIIPTAVVPAPIKTSTKAQSNAKMKRSQIVACDYIDASHVKYCLEQKMIIATKIICSRIAIDLKWHNYELLRLAAQDKSPNIFNALFPFL
jgi:hypothetical protein